IQHIPAPLDTPEEPLQLQVALLDYSDYVYSNGDSPESRETMKVGQRVIRMNREGTQQAHRRRELCGVMGLGRKEIEHADSGDILAVSGTEDRHIGETICSPDHLEPLPMLRIDEPTLKMTFLVNNSPFAGKEGEFMTSRQIKERLMKELETDVSLR